MRLTSNILGLLGLGYLLQSAFGLSYSAQPFCALNATVFVTVSSVTTVTLNDAATQTIYLAHPASQLEPFTTETRTRTLTISPAKLATVYITSKTSEHDTTVTEIDLVTVTNAQITAASSGDIVTYSEIAASDGLYDIIVVNGTTYWLNGQTPAPSSSHVVKTSFVTVEPVITSVESHSEDETSTVTIHSTVVFTQELTITETIPRSSRSFQLSQVSGYPSAPVSFTGIASGGWNASTTARNAIVGISNSTLTVQTSLSSVNIYGKPPPITITSYAAESGFNQFITSLLSSASEIVAPNTSTVAGTFTTTSCTDKATLGATATTSYHVDSTSGSALTTEHAAKNTTSTPAASNPVQASTAGGIFTTSCTDKTSSSAGLFSNYTSSIPASMTSSADDSIISTSLSPISSLTSIAGTNSSFSAPVSDTSSANGVLTSIGRLSRTILMSHTSSVLSSVATQSIVLSTYTVIPLPRSSVTLDKTVVPATWTTLVSKATPTYASALPSSTSCGEQGDFVLNFDDLPPLTISPDQNTTFVDSMPLFSPYHKFKFSAGFLVVPPPTDPYLPSSKPLLVEFLPKHYGSSLYSPITGPGAPLYGYSGDIGNADHGLLGCFGFNIYGASLGCNSTGPGCIFTFSGFRYDSTTRLTNAITSQRITVPACSALTNCNLSSVTLDSTFVKLDSVRINVTVAGAPQTWWMDDIRLGWTDDSCAAGLCRANAHIH